ncbi:MAG: hypothetical protein WBX15_20005 [Thermoanaerobaculia bacterium]
MDATPRKGFRASERESRTPREVILVAAAAAWGFAVAIAASPLVQGSAVPGQIEGALKRSGTSPHGPIIVLLLLVIVPLASGAVTGALLSRIGEMKRWVSTTISIALVSALWIRLVGGSLTMTALAPAAGVLLTLLAARVEPRWSRMDVVLIPSTLSLYLAFLDLGSANLVFLFVAAVFLLFALRLAVAAMLPFVRVPAVAFTFAPLALLLQSSWFRSGVAHAGWPSFALVAGSPLLVSLLLRKIDSSTWFEIGRVERAALALLVLFVFPVVAIVDPSITTTYASEQRPRVDVFEDGHSLLPASEMVAGELPYRDVVPAHGLISDGLLDAVSIRAGARSIGDVLEKRAFVAESNGAVIYLLGLAASGSGAVGLLGFYLTRLLFPSLGFIRVIPSLIALAMACMAVRRRRDRWFAAAGAVIVLAALTSLDFGLYVLIAVAVLALRSAVVRRAFRPVVMLVAGISAVAVIVLIAFVATGITGDFFRSTFHEIPSVSAAYLLDFTVPDAVKGKSLLALLARLLDRDSLRILGWPLAVLTLAVLLAAPFRRRREPLIGMLVWVSVAGVSWAERHHDYFMFVLPTVLIVATVLMLRSRRHEIRLAGIASAVALAVAAQPTSYLVMTTMIRTHAASRESGWTDIWEIPRARFALFPLPSADAIREMKTFIDRELRPGETWLDLSNAPILYYLFDRRCPVRQVEPAMYSTESLQRDVIRRLERDRSVRAVLVRFPSGTEGIDGLSNRERVPLVWQWVEQNFHPEFQGAGVEIWIRDDALTSPWEPRYRRSAAADSRDGLPVPTEALVSLPPSFLPPQPTSVAAARTPPRPLEPRPARPRRAGPPEDR